MSELSIKIFVITNIMVPGKEWCVINLFMEALRNDKIIRIRKILKLSLSSCSTDVVLVENLIRYQNRLEIVILSETWRPKKNISSRPALSNLRTSFPVMLVLRRVP